MHFIQSLVNPFPPNVHKMTKHMLQILQNSGRNFLNVYLTILWKLVVIGLTVINSLKTFLAHIKQIFGPSSYLF